MQLLHLRLGRLRRLLRLRFAKEYRRQTLQGLLLPLARHRLMDAVLGRQLRVVSSPRNACRGIFALNSAK